MTTWREYYTEESELKKDIVDRIKKARADGVPTGKIVKECSETMSIHIIYDMLEAKMFPIEVWEKVDKGLKKLGY